MMLRVLLRLESADSRKKLARMVVSSNTTSTRVFARTSPVAEIETVWILRSLM